MAETRGQRAESTLPASRTRTDCLRLEEEHRSPALALRDILALDPVRGSEPELLAGEGAWADRPVRWVHSSEVYEGANFLDGGELLLTNGSGLTDADEDTRRRYVRELTARGAASSVEVGRSLVRMPEEVVDEARRLGLPLLALHRVVPFVRITEAANRAIVARGLSGQAASMRPWGGDHTAALLADLTDGQALNQPEVEARAALAGFHPGPGARLVGVSAHGARRAGRGRPGGPLPGRGRGAAGGVPGGCPGAGGDAGRRRTGGDGAARCRTGRAGGLADGRRGRDDRGGRTRGPRGRRLAALERDTAAARTTLELALTVPSAEPGPTGGPVVTSSRALTLERELTRGGVDANRDRLARLVQHTLGPLLACREAAHPSDLVRTLEIHLRHGCSPTRTAALLHIGRRLPLCQRLERINPSWAWRSTTRTSWANCSGPVRAPDRAGGAGDRGRRPARTVA